ncbi:MAG: hypothetical protein JW803_04330 [Endomicrobiales bacterium]|nr:hypothetical protein [Endomicrobiales bacterium]
MKKMQSGKPTILSQMQLDIYRIRARRQREYWEATKDKTKEAKARNRAIRHKIALTLSSQHDWKIIRRIAEEKKRQKQAEKP